MVKDQGIVLYSWVTVSLRPLGRGQGRVEGQRADHGVSEVSGQGGVCVCVCVSE